MSRQKSQLKPGDHVFIRLLAAGIEESKRLPNGDLNYRLFESNGKGSRQFLCMSCVGLWLFGESKIHRAEGVWITKDGSYVALCEGHGEDYDFDHDIEDYADVKLFEHADLTPLGFGDSSP